MIHEYQWDEAPMMIMEQGYMMHMENLFTQIMEGTEDGGTEVLDTESGEPFCGCEICEVRETLAYLVPRVVGLYRDGFLREAVTQ